MEFKARIWILLAFVALFGLNGDRMVNGLKCRFCAAKDEDDDACDDPSKMSCDSDFYSITADHLKNGGYSDITGPYGQELEEPEGPPPEGPVSFVCAKLVGRFGVVGGEQWPEEITYRGCIPRHPKYVDGKYEVKSREVIFPHLNVDFQGDIDVGAASAIGISVLTLALGVIMALCCGGLQ